MRLSTLGCAFATAFMVLASGLAGAQNPIVIKFSHVAALDTPKGQGAERFKKLAEERTKGRVRVDIYPNSALFKDKEELEALQMGSVQMLAPSISKFGPFGVKEFEVFDLPFVTPDLPSFQRVANSDFGQAMLKRLESRGVRGLAYWDAGFRVITANKPLRRLADYKGMKIRINSSKVIEAQMRSIGVMPQTMAFSEVYQALQTGVVDGADTVMSNALTQKFYEVQKHIALLHHSHQAYAVVVNKKFWDGLPEDIRKALETAMADATTHANGLSVAEERDAMEKIKASGKTTIYEPTPAERDEIRKAMMVVHRDMESRLGRDNIQAMYKAAGFVPPK
ncbi:MAG: DctP family TRAP transporter solute-binding subunit [Rhodocyclales bacterium GT-UBC]|nr:MAG: DctP family TRAP transporter solute-binding subunit [Rhodocyclales bacterium GT-UBC]